MQYYWKLIKLAVESDTTIIKGIAHKQIQGLAMGNNLSPLMAIVYMDHIETLAISSTNGSVVFWVRYIDDIFIIAKNPIDEIMEKANAISPVIKFTSELPNSNGEIAFLDTLVHMKDKTNISGKLDVLCKLYSKPQHSGHIIPWSSHVPLVQKIALLSSERIRTIRNCTTRKATRESLAKHKERFLCNGYPKEIVEKYYLKGSKRNRTNNNDARKIIRLRFPFINDYSAKKVRELLKKSKLPVKLVPTFVTTQPLHRQLKRATMFTPKHNCVGQTEKCICFRKNIVYEIECTICHKKYVGETHRTFMTRFKEHHMASTKSHYYEHWIKEHHTEPEPDKANCRILGSGYRDTIQRTVDEALWIKKTGASINIQHTNN